MDVKNSAGEQWQGGEKYSRENLYCLRNYLNHHKQNVSKNMDSKDAAGERLGGSEKDFIRNWGRGYLLYNSRKQLNYILQIHEKQNLWGMNLDIYLRTFLSKVLMVQAGLFLFIIVKCERKEISWRMNYKQRNWDLVIWEILSLYRLEEMLNQEIHYQEEYSGEKPNVWLDNLLVMLWKDQKIRVFIHTEGS